MSRPNALEVAREDARFQLRRALDASAMRGHRDPASIADAGGHLHTLGVVALLADARADEFARLLALAGQTDLECRALDLADAPRLAMASRHVPFADALVAGDLDTARAVAGLCPAAHQEGHEYEEDFLRYRFMHLLVGSIGVVV